MKIEGIKNGIVIDHIKAGIGFKIYEALCLKDLECSVAIITNARSQIMGKKDIIKIDKSINLDLDAIGYLDSGVTINIIREDKVVDKHMVKLPETLVNIIKCKNPRCITSSERNLSHVFELSNRDNGIYRCKYCDTLHSIDS